MKLNWEKCVFNYEGQRKMWKLFLMRSKIHENWQDEIWYMEVCGCQISLTLGLVRYPFCRIEVKGNHAEKVSGFIFSNGCCGVKWMS